MDELVPSGIRKVNEKALAMERAGETVIHFELGRPDFDTPEYIKNACIEDIKKGDVFYTSNFGTMELREAIAWKLKTQLYIKQMGHIRSLYMQENFRKKYRTVLIW